MKNWGSPVTEKLADTVSGLPVGKEWRKRNDRGELLCNGPCKRWRKVGNFYRCRRTRNGYQSICIDCQREGHRLDRQCKRAARELERQAG